MQAFPHEEMGTNGQDHMYAWIGKSDGIGFPFHYGPGPRPHTNPEELWSVPNTNLDDVKTPTTPGNSESSGLLVTEAVFEFDATSRRLRFRPESEPPDDYSWESPVDSDSKSLMSCAESYDRTDTCHEHYDTDDGF